MRIIKSLPVSDRNIFYKKMLNWANRFNICSFLEDHNYSGTYHFQRNLIAAGSVRQLDYTPELTSAHIDSFIQAQEDWIFFHLSFETISILNKEFPVQPDKYGFTPFSFFVPQYVIRLNQDSVEIESLALDHEIVFNQILAEPVNEEIRKQQIDIQQRLSKEAYLEKIKGLLSHIHRGDCYEINFCQEFFAEQVLIDPIQMWRSLCNVSPNPFSVYSKQGNSFLMSASPERFLCKQGEKLVSQPMKGTIRRDLNNQAHDEQLKELLLQSKKDQMENVMVVDLVRNDLSKVCLEGSVKVSELFGVYKYPQVYQMISTVEGVSKNGITFMDIMYACFPMGSMTGAPKIRVLELIREYEQIPRGLFSGSLGYISPEGDFDMNVLIRTMFYNARTQYLSFMTGSGITYLSDPEQEYEECLLKGAAIRSVLS